VLETREQTELKEDDQMLETSGSNAMKFAHIMLDIETLSTKPNALVLSYCSSSPRSTRRVSVGKNASELTTLP
jgi:hypothetical protein